jgi:hypothetical protein
MDDILLYAPLAGLVLIMALGWQVSRLEKQNEGLYNMLRELLDKRR